MYEEATSSIHINGHISGPIPIQSSVRQECPMSMLLFAICVDPLLLKLDQILPGIRIGNQARKIFVVAYADDITICVTTPKDIPIISDTKQCDEKATGARPNTEIEGSGGGRIDYREMNIKYRAEIKILGVNFASTIEHSMNKRWTNVTGKGYLRAGLKLLTTDSLMQAYLLAEIWHTAQ